ncbi:hypothetical protein PRUPE_4G058600 [Prunus persica]|uniref:Uncharacterized protein n=1 Tax=Prunus persica TaxID=3760 RepID=M5WLQ0_PRUPE|nr:hypothetical protein PRUPE_4G058600 [Prunus persica]
MGHPVQMKTIIASCIACVAVSLIGSFVASYTLNIGGTPRTCCGGGGPYNYNSAQASACHGPSQFINWDAIRFTEAAYRWMTNDLLKGKYTIPQIGTLCVSEV